MWPFGKKKPLYKVRVSLEYTDDTTDIKYLHGYNRGDIADDYRFLNYYGFLSQVKREDGYVEYKELRAYRIHWEDMENVNA